MSTSIIPVTVSAIETISPVIKEFTLVGRDHGLPGFSPGSHVVVNMPGSERQYRNAYSLLGDPADASCYRIAVRQQESSRGGSRFMHQEVKVGDQLTISPPSNLFLPSWEAHHHILIAGGIGITPFLSYLHEFARRGVSHELHYRFRDSGAEGYLPMLDRTLGANLHLYSEARPDFYRLLEGRPLGSHVYVCGPQEMIQDVIHAARDLGWSEARVHHEVFAVAEPGSPFVARLAGAGHEIAVEGDVSLLEALEANGIEIPNQCRGGVCGQCKTTVIEGRVEHRDTFLDDHERQRHDCIMPCVSRSLTDTLILDL
jgi:ferredoxin-NADP reductase